MAPADMGTSPDGGIERPDDVPMLPYVGFFASIYLGGLAVIFVMASWLPLPRNLHLDGGLILAAATATHWRFLKGNLRRLSHAEFWQVVMVTFSITLAVNVVLAVEVVSRAGKGDALRTAWFWVAVVALEAPYFALHCAGFSAGGKQMLARALRRAPGPTAQPIDPG